MMSRTKTIAALLALIILLFGVCPLPPLSMNAASADNAWDQSALLHRSEFARLNEVGVSDQIIWYIDHRGGKR